MSSDGQAALATVLDFLFAANIEAADAFAAAKSLLEAGCTTREAIAALTPERAKQLTPKKCHRKLLAALRKSALPTLDTPESPAPESKRQRAEAPPPPPPPPPADGADPDIVINRSPVMILWAAAIAHVTYGHDWAEALSLASACAAKFARAKGASLGLHSTASSSSSSSDDVHLLGSDVPCERTADGSLRGTSEHRHKPGCFDIAHPSGVHRSLASGFGEHFGAAWAAMTSLARAVPEAEMKANGNRRGYELYAEFRPPVPAGLAGWGQPGRLRLGQLDEMRRGYGPAAGSSSSSSSAAAVKVEAALPAAVAPAPPPPVKAEEEAVVKPEDAGDGPARVYAAIADSGDGKGLSHAELQAAVGADAAIVSGWVEELQSDGSIYQGADGRLLLL